MKEIIICDQGDICYVIEKVQAKRGIGKDKKADEVLIYGFNKSMHPELYDKYMKIVEGQRNER